MKNLLLVSLLILVLFAVTGCESGFTTGAAVGTGAGALLQNTIAGAKKDLETREQILVTAYNEGVAIGAKQEDLDAIAKEIELIRQGKAGVEVGEQFLGLNWNDPKQTGLAIGSLIELALLVFGGKKLRSTNKLLTETEAILAGTKLGINKFSGLNDPKIASLLYDTIKEKVNQALAT